MRFAHLQRFVLAAVLTALVLLARPVAADVPADPAGAYAMRFTVPLETLTADFGLPPRYDPHEEGEIVYSRWYVMSSYPTASRQVVAAWGPRARRYPAPTPPAGVDAVTWKRERVLAAAQKLIGYGYQHHHLPDFDPGPGWPWRKVATGRNGKGVDCSNFTAFCYNYALGMQLPTAIGSQSDMRDVEGLQVASLELPPSRAGAPTPFERFTRVLAPGDLLFVRNRGERVAHVVIWVGANGAGCRDPLVIDSTDVDTADDKGQGIPHGVQLRPFRDGGRYHTLFDHAVRLIR